MRPSFSLLFFLVLVTTSCNNNNKETTYQTFSGEVWNTEFNIIYEGSNHLKDSISEVFDNIDKSLSLFNNQSVVSAVNNNCSHIVDSDFIAVYNASKEIYRNSRGRFDPTLAPIISAWGFGENHKATVDTAHIYEILKYTGIEKTYLRADTLFKEDSRIQFNFSGIAKGYGCDQTAAMLKRNGVENFLIEIGGEIAAGGVNHHGKRWRVSIDKPLGSANLIIHQSQAIVEISECGLATSGNYRNYHTSFGQQYGHTILPETGRPAETDILSVTIIAPTATIADGMSTACLTMNSRQAAALCDSLGYAAIMILSDSTTLCTSLMKAILPAP